MKKTVLLIVALLSLNVLSTTILIASAASHEVSANEASEENALREETKQIQNRIRQLQQQSRELKQKLQQLRRPKKKRSSEIQKDELKKEKTLKQEIEKQDVKSKRPLTLQEAERYFASNDEKDLFSMEELSKFPENWKEKLYTKSDGSPEQVKLQQRMYEILLLLNERREGALRLVLLNEKFEDMLERFFWKPITDQQREEEKQKRAGEQAQRLQNIFSSLSLEESAILSEPQRKLLETKLGSLCDTDFWIKFNNLREWLKARIPQKSVPAENHLKKKEKKELRKEK